MSPFISKLFASRFGQAVIVAGAYYLVAKLSLLLAFKTTNATAIWPPTGIALAAVLLLGYRIWPAIALAGFFANLDTLSALGYTLHLALAGAFSTAIGHTLGMLACGFLVLHFTEGRNPFGRTGDIVRFVLFGALLGTTVSGVFGACTLSFLNGRWSNFGLTWLTWWLGDAVAILIITPLIMTWEMRRKSGWTPLKIAEVAAILALLAVIGWVVFGKGFTIPYMFIPLFIWAAFRFDLFEGACLIMLTLCLSIWGATEGVFVYHEVTHTISLILTQVYISIVSVMTMLLTSLINERNTAFADLRRGNEYLLQEITERKRAEEALKQLNEELEQRVYDRIALLQRKTEELELANERLKEVDRLKSAFLASMSHELRTPLNSVIGFSTILLNEWAGPANAEQKQNLASILNSGRHLLNMINDVLDVTQIEAGTITSVNEEFDLYDLLNEAENEVAAAIREKGLELRSELLRQRMRTDRRRLLQCVLNILNNAVKFTDRGSVTMAARLVSSPVETPAEDMVEIAVTDTGIGIAEEDQVRIFQPFHRIVTPERAIVPGTGLGLFLTRKIAAEILNGDILVSSECGKGSRFSLRIPVRLTRT